MLGFVNLNKPAGWTSHDCVAKLRRFFKLKRVGHGGTLDPAATGVLPIALGRATKLLAYLPENKAYRARIRLGMQTTTDDLEGDVIQTKSASQLTLESIQPFLAQFNGILQQVPPQFSAIHKDGKRLYELARQGESIQVSPRTVRVDRLTILAWHPGEFPELEVEIACGSGTYIRAIARDLGAALQVGGTLANLVRTESGGFGLEQSLTLEQIEAQLLQESLVTISVDAALKHLPVVSLNDTEAKRWCQGQKIALRENIHSTQTQVRVQGSERCLGIAWLIELENDWWLVPKVVLIP